MIFAFIRSSIGSLGRAILDFYIANSLVINAIILLYALLVFIAHRNYFYALEKIFIQLAPSDVEKKPLRKINPSQYNALAWNTLRKLIRFPLISEPKKWTFRYCTTGYLKKEFSLEKLNQFLKSNLK
ncbi:MAG: hypothetical protein MUO42_11390 [Anaerolineaceae bacterium]|nr:hypothetical protein [Anaerolineaceae bacterium]